MDRYSNNLELLDSSESFEPMEVAHQSLLRSNTFPFLLEETAETSLVRTNTCLLPLGSVPSPLLATRPITSSQKSAGPVKEGQRLHLKGVAGLSQRVLAGAWGVCVGLLLGVRDQGDKNIWLDKEDFIDLGVFI